MTKLFSFARAIFIRFAPTFVQESRFIAATKQLFPHDLLYDAEYYGRHIEPSAAAASEVMAPSIIADLAPRTLVDVGCGSGALLESIRKRGCAVFGLEYAEGGLAFCRKRNLDVQKFDLEHDTFPPDRTFDVAVSMEVAEHLPERCADRFTDLLVLLSSVVVFTAAHPGQGGTDHVNEQPASYWIQKFSSRGFEFDEAHSAAWREQWKRAGIAKWYWMNIMIFRRKQLGT